MLYKAIMFSAQILAGVLRLLGGIAMMPIVILVSSAYPTLTATLRHYVSVFRGKFVSIFTVGLSNVNCHDAIATQGIFPTGNGFKVGRIYARRAATEMVELQSFWNCPDEHFKSDLMSSSMPLSPSVPKLSVTLPIPRCCPNPALRTAKPNIGMGANFGEEAYEYIGVNGKSVRIVLNHLSLQLGFDGLGFRGLTHREALSF